MTLMYLLYFIILIKVQVENLKNNTKIILLLRYLKNMRSNRHISLYCLLY